MPTADLPEQIEPLDDEVAEEWVRRTVEPDVRGVSAHRLRDGGDWPWRITVFAAEFVREEPLEGELRNTVRAALKAVAGVTRVEEEDREIWVIGGRPDAEALVLAAAAAVDRMQDKLRAHIRQL
jgi:hypothetical protein